MPLQTQHVRWGRVLLASFLLWAVSVGDASAQGEARSTVVRDTIDHAPFNDLLTRFVDARGNVDYSRLKLVSDSVLVPYLQQYATVDLSQLDRDERLALWINAYNAFTLKLIVDHYPVENIWAITPGPAEPKEESPFELDVGRVADTVRTLDEIEHEIIRQRFDEPRIHFALVCAAKSCPRLRREAYVRDRLHQQLEDQTRTFLHDRTKNQIPAGEGTILLSRILDWYGEDFGASTSDLQRFVASYFNGEIGARLEKGAYDVEFRSYDWTLNDQ